MLKKKAEEKARKAEERKNVWNKSPNNELYEHRNAAAVK